MTRQCIRLFFLLGIDRYVIQCYESGLISVQQEGMLLVPAMHTLLLALCYIVQSPDKER